jgi:hypothetical protein
MEERIVTVRNKRCVVKVEQKSKRVWVAAGEYMGELHLINDRSAGAAVMRWLEWTNYKCEIQNVDKPKVK